MTQAHPVAVLGLHAQDVAHNVDFELVEVAVYGRAEQCLELVRAAGDLGIGARLDLLLCKWWFVIWRGLRLALAF